METNWARRLFINTALDLTVNKLCVLVISIVGEESYKIYSKRVFNEERYINTNADAIINSMESDLEDVTETEVDDYLASQGLEEKMKSRGKR